MLIAFSFFIMHYFSLFIKHVLLENEWGNVRCSVMSNSSTLTSWCKELTHLKRPWCWERLKAGGEGNDRGWAGWMASPTQCTWAWASSGTWWQTGRPGVIQSMGLQKVRHNWKTELNRYLIFGVILVHITSTLLNAHCLSQILLSLVIYTKTTLSCGWDWW